MIIKFHKFFWENITINFYLLDKEKGLDKLETPKSLFGLLAILKIRLPPFLDIIKTNPGIIIIISI